MADRKCDAPFCDEPATSRPFAGGSRYCEECRYDYEGEPAQYEPTEEDDRNAAESDRIQMYMDEH